jgi:hypothetical protein
MARLWVLVPALCEFYCSCKGKSSTVTSLFLEVISIYIIRVVWLLINSVVDATKGGSVWWFQHDIIRCGS